ncbi:MAG: hypothetical protein AAFP20_23850 [Cyanobacteria bacterium J06614_10]
MKARSGISVLGFKDVFISFRKKLRRYRNKSVPWLEPSFIDHFINSDLVEIAKVQLQHILDSDLNPSSSVEVDQSDVVSNASTSKSSNFSSVSKSSSRISRSDLTNILKSVTKDFSDIVDRKLSANSNSQVQSYLESQTPNLISTITKGIEVQLEKNLPSLDGASSSDGDSFSGFKSPKSVKSVKRLKSKPKKVDVKHSLSDLAGNKSQFSSKEVTRRQDSPINQMVVSDTTAQVHHVASVSPAHSQQVLPDSDDSVPVFPRRLFHEQPSTSHDFVPHPSGNSHSGIISFPNENPRNSDVNSRAFAMKFFPDSSEFVSYPAEPNQVIPNVTPYFQSVGVQTSGNLIQVIPVTPPSSQSVSVQTSTSLIESNQVVSNSVSCSQSVAIQTPFNPLNSPVDSHISVSAQTYDSTHPTPPPPPPPTPPSVSVPSNLDSSQINREVEPVEIVDDSIVPDPSYQRLVKVAMSAADVMKNPGVWYEINPDSGLVFDSKDVLQSLCFDNQIFLGRVVVLYPPNTRKPTHFRVKKFSHSKAPKFSTKQCLLAAVLSSNPYLIEKDKDDLKADNFKPAKGFKACPIVQLDCTEDYIPVNIPFSTHYKWFRNMVLRPSWKVTPADEDLSYEGLFSWTAKAHLIEIFYQEEMSKNALSDEFNLSDSSSIRLPNNLIQAEFLARKNTGHAISAALGVISAFAVQNELLSHPAARTDGDILAGTFSHVIHLVNVHMEQWFKAKIALRKFALHSSQSEEVMDLLLSDPFSLNLFDPDVVDRIKQKLLSDKKSLSSLTRVFDPVKNFSLRRKSFGRASSVRSKYSRYLNDRLRKNPIQSFGEFSGSSSGNVNRSVKRGKSFRGSRGKGSGSFKSFSADHSQPGQSFRPKSFSNSSSSSNRAKTISNKSSNQ